MSPIGSSVRRRDIAWASALVVLVSAMWIARSDLVDAGTSPPGTGIAVVYVAVASNFPDSLGVGPGAGLNGAPIILIPTNPPIPAATEAELVRLDPRTVVIIGGTAVVSAAMETELGVVLPNAAIDRIAGGDRYETNAMFSESVFPVEGWFAVPTVSFTGTHPDTASVVLTPGAAYSAASMYAPVHLHHGAEILGLLAQVNDTNSGDGIGVRLRRVGFFTNEILAEAFSGDSYAGGELSMADTLLDLANTVVDNQNYSYMIEVYTSGSDRSLINVIIWYRLGMSG